MAKMLPEIDKRLERFGVTGVGRDWLLRALHPAGQELRCPGVPDESAVPVLRPEFRTEFTISPPASLTSSTYDVLLIQCSGDVNSVYWIAAPAGTDFSATPAGQPASGVAAGVISSQPTLDLPGDTTYTFWTGGLTETHSVRCSAARPQAYRHMYSSMTVDQIAAAVADQGEVYSAQFPPVFQEMAFLSTTGSSPGLGIFNQACPVVINIPLTETDMALLSPEYYSGQARDGVYVPLRHSGPNNVPFVFPRTVRPFYSSYDNSNQTGYTQIPLLVQTVLPWFTNTPAGRPYGVANLPWWCSPLGAGPTVTGVTQPTYGADLGFSNMNIGVTIFRGLAGSTGGGFGASLKVKVCTGLELIPMTVTPDRVYARPAIAYDPLALEAYYRVVVELSDAYPSSYNGFSEILSTIGSIGKAVWPAIRSIGDSLSGSGGPAAPEARAIAPPPPPAVSYRPPPSQPMAQAKVRKAKMAKLQTRARSASAKPKRR